jgi:hypothetical protein
MQTCLAANHLKGTSITVLSYLTYNLFILHPLDQGYEVEWILGFYIPEIMLETLGG